MVSMKRGNFPNLVRESIDRLGLSMLQFSRMSKIPFSTLQAIAAGKKKPREKTIKKIIKGFGGKKTAEDLGLN